MVYNALDTIKPGYIKVNRKELKQHFKKLGAYIRKTRKKKGISRERLVELSGVHLNTIGRIERGEVDSPLSIWAAVFLALDLNMALILRYLKRLSVDSAPLMLETDGED